VAKVPLAQAPLSVKLSGKRILITGATGFVGEALLERLLFDLPDTKIILVVRPRGITTAAQRVEHMLNGSTFGRLRERYGDDAVNALVGSQVTVLEGDLDHVPDLPADLDVVIHCAGEVSFDPPIDEGFTTNLLGTLNLLAAIDASGSHPHYVHVSTAYVAGRQQGHIREGRLDHDVDWRAEAEHATALRQRIEIDSRSSAQLAIFSDEAEKEHGIVGASSISATPNAGAPPGWPSRWSTPVVSGDAAWAGPTATRSPRRWPSERSRTPRRTYR
jgi:alcohol-forming fatty acyl-CoA reductase